MTTQTLEYKPAAPDTAPDTARDAAPDAAPDQAAALEQPQSDLRQFVTFVVGDDVFAVDMAPVQEIIRVPDVVRVPLAPPTLDGLANLRGKVLPIISLRRIFGFADRAYDEATRAVVIEQGQALGFVVDRVASVVGVDPRQIEEPDTISAAIHTRLVSGMLKDVGGYPMIMVLDFAKLVASEFADLAVMSEHPASVRMAPAERAQAEDDGGAGDDQLQLVSFEVAQQEYAISIDDVEEIVQVPERIMHVPHSAPHVLGVMTLRKRLLPLVSLRSMFGLPPRAADDNSRIVVVALGTASVGVVMDRVNEVLRVARADVDAMPALLARDGQLSEIAHICRLDGGKRLVSILSVGHMFGHAAIKDALSTLDTMHGANEDGARQRSVSVDEDTNDDEEQLVVFRLGKEEFGVAIDTVQEIVRVSAELTHVPKAPPAVVGVINLRGTVLPVLDLRRRLGLGAVECSDRQRIMVFLIDGIRTGFIVDSVAEVLKIHKSSIEPAPCLGGEPNRLMARMANLEKQKRMVQLIEPEYLIEKQDLPEFAQFGAA